MGTVVNKSLKRVRKDIAKKADKLHEFLYENLGNVWDLENPKQERVLQKLAAMCYDLVENVDSLDEIAEDDS